MPTTMGIVSPPPNSPTQSLDQVKKNSTDESFRNRKVMQPKQLSTRTDISEAIGRIGITVKHYLIGLFDSRTTKIPPTDGLCGKR